MNALERMHFFDGQRLSAQQLRAEQHYHIAVSRLLHRGLFTAGVVNGLEVDPVANQPRQVRVRHGLALDPLGRAVVLANNRFLAVPNQPAKTSLEGYYLAVRYRETPVPADDQGCAADATAEPGRIREDPALYWTEEYPDHRRCGSRGHGSDCAVVIAVVRLTPTCTVAGIETGLRQYAAPTHTSQVQGFALEGEKDIDKDNPKVLHFQVRGGPPASMVLYLWGAKFTTLFYSELTYHSHSMEAAKIAPATLTDHTHGSEHQHSYKTSARTTTTQEDRDGGRNPHGHALYTHARVYGNPPIPHYGEPGHRVVTDDHNTSQTGYHVHGYSTRGGFEDSRPPFVEVGGEHEHSVPEIGASSQPRVGSAIVDPPRSPTHDHTMTANFAAVGVTNSSSRIGSAYQYLDDLRVLMDGKDVTSRIIGSLPQDWMGKLGNGFESHPVNQRESGTGAIDLLDLGIAIGEGPHTLEFCVKNGGGKVLYNLYVQ